MKTQNRPSRSGSYKSKSRTSSRSSTSGSRPRQSNNSNNSSSKSSGNSRSPKRTGSSSSSSSRGGSRGGFKRVGSSSGGFKNRSRSSGGFKNKSRSGGSRGGNRSGGGNRNRGGRKMATFDPTKFINTNPVEVKQEVYVAKHTFETFGLSKELYKNVARNKMTVPSPIQDQIIPEILKGRDVIGLAETGTGKTAAFLLPIIEKTLADDSRQTLILTPTRELAIQINEELRVFVKGMRIFSTICVGGMGITPQIKSLKRKNHFIIGTPGRILDLINRKNFLPKNVTTVVLDEADRMLDMGFIHDMRKILSQVPTKREMLLFSATMDNVTGKLVNDFLNNPVEVSVKKKDVTDSIAQDVVEHVHNNKFETLLGLLKKPDFKRVIIFGSMKHSVEKLSRELVRNGIKSESIHGNKTHGQRQRSLKAFKDGQSQVLVATDVAARGIHVDNVSHVINYDLPNTFEDYVHRIGRTGRGSKRGKALSFVTKRAIKDRY